MVSVEALSMLLGVPVFHLINTYITQMRPRHHSVLAKGFFGYPETIDIINAEGNREFATADAKLVQNKLRQGRVVCNRFGCLEVR